MRTATRVLIGSVAIALVAAACGGGGGEGDESKEKSFSYEISEPADLTPGNSNESEGGTVIDTVFDQLTRVDPKTGDAVMQNAESVESSDRKVWTIKLKDGWKFHNGEPVTAESYVGAWNAVLTEAWANGYFFSDLLKIKGAADVPKKSKTMAGLKAVDKTTIEMTLDEPNTNLPLIIGYSAFAPMPESVLKSKDWKAFKEKPVGNGPYQMAEPWKHNQFIKLKKYGDYSGDTKAKADAITLKIYDNLATSYNDVVAGNLDVSRVPPERLTSAKRDFGDRYLQTPSTSFNYYGFPLWQKEFKDVRIRQAISMAINREEIDKQLLNGTVTPATGLVTPMIKLGKRDDPCGETCSFNPTKAKQLYQEAGGIDGPLEFWFNSGSGHDEYVQAMANQLKKNLGIKVTLKQQAWAQYQTAVQDKKMRGPFRMGWIMDYPSPDNYLGPMYTKNGSNNGTGYSNPKVEKLLAQGNAAETPDDAVEYYQKAEDIILKDMPILPLWFGENQTVHSEKVSNLKRNGLGRLMLDQIKVSDS